jgi:hypothetical protein
LHDPLEDLLPYVHLAAREGCLQGVVCERLGIEAADLQQPPQRFSSVRVL